MAYLQQRAGFIKVSFSAGKVILVMELYKFEALNRPAIHLFAAFVFVLQQNLTFIFGY